MRSARGPAASNPFLSPRDMTIKEVVSIGLKRPEFGHDFYNTPSNEMLMKKVPFGLSDK